MQKLGTIGTLLRIFPYAKSALPRVILGTVAALLGHLFALAIPGFLRSLVDQIAEAAKGSNLSDAIYVVLLPAVLAVLGLGLMEATMVLLRRWLVLTPGTHVEAGLRKTLYAKLQDLPVAFHDKWPSGQLLSRATGDLSLIRRWLSFGLVLLVANVATIVIGFAVLFSYNWILALVFLIIMSPLWVLGFKFEKDYHVTARVSQDQAGDLATAVEESVHGIRVLKAFGRGSFITDKFARDALNLRSTELKKAKMVSNLWFYFSTIPDIALGVCLVIGVFQISEHTLTIGELSAFILTTRVLHWPIDSIGFLLSMTIDARTAVERFFEVIDTKVDIADPDQAKTLTEPHGRLIFENVHFRYSDAPENQPDLLNGINLEIEPGESVALIGITGCGKTSLTALATRLYEVTQGAIKLDGVDIRDFSREELRSHIAMAFEDATLFSDSVRNNVLLGRPESTEEDLKQALEIAQAQFVYELPDGLETKIGEEGMSLSGGQRQRLALARAVAAKPAVLVLDDPLSALDVDTEAMVEDALRTVLKSTTALIVAHRPSTVQLADRVALLQDGKITAFGKHSDLLATNEHYRYVISSLDAAGKLIEVNN
ncbi:MAG: ABC transporter ATP-binding protein [Micrococcales bacterium]|nr:ABC transporter ATP-binding protein [Micrococcales bacterium]NBR61337.1 ABC transporter ATP-binding protein [Actinomycetota bacterium]NBR54520.1 ABC transporter ATP-binding protein [Micrococcales bacterium]NBT46543.1 ABC transporter ATP-binding protein [Actinomycetota bacterium]NBY43898.1 ABC transporter ATP-binding protein [Micrococcales bacterium]